eukprot:g2174.t1
MPRSAIAVGANCSQLYGMRVCCPALAEALAYLQLMQPCERGRYRIVDKKKYWNGGIGAVLVDRFMPERRKALGAGKGLAFVVPRVPWIYHKTCVERWWECAFYPASSCRAPSSTVLSPRNASSHVASPAPPLPPGVLDEARRVARDGGLFLAHTLALTLAPLPELQRSMARTKRDIGWRHPIIGVHMRHGDIWREHAVPSSVAYAEAVAQVYAQTGIPRVFLATNDKRASPATFARLVRTRAEALGVAMPTDLTIIQQGVERQDSGEEDKRHEQTHKQAQAAFLDLLLLSESDALVCMFGSGFGKVATLLGAVRHGLNRFAFVDCDEWGGNVPPAPALNWLPGYTRLVPWHGLCQRHHLIKPPGRSRWAPDNAHATAAQNRHCASDPNCCEKDCAEVPDTDRT